MFIKVYMIEQHIEMLKIILQKSWGLQTIQNQHEPTRFELQVHDIMLMIFYKNLF
jgi:hypothetical protein